MPPALAAPAPEPDDENRPRKRVPRRTPTEQRAGAFDLQRTSFGEWGDPPENSNVALEGIPPSKEMPAGVLVVSFTNGSGHPIGAIRISNLDRDNFNALRGKFTGINAYRDEPNGRLRLSSQVLQDALNSLLDRTAGTAKFEATGDIQADSPAEIAHAYLTHYKSTARDRLPTYGTKVLFDNCSSAPANEQTEGEGGEVAPKPVVLLAVENARTATQIMQAAFDALKLLVRRDVTSSFTLPIRSIRRACFGDFRPGYVERQKGPNGYEVICLREIKVSAENPLELQRGTLRLLVVKGAVVAVYDGLSRIVEAVNSNLARDRALLIGDKAKGETGKGEQRIVLNHLEEYLEDLQEAAQHLGTVVERFVKSGTRPTEAQDRALGTVLSHFRETRQAASNLRSVIPFSCRREEFYLDHNDYTEQYRTLDQQAKALIEKIRIDVASLREFRRHWASVDRVAQNALEKERLRVDNKLAVIERLRLLNSGAWQELATLGGVYGFPAAVTFGVWGAGQLLGDSILGDVGKWAVFSAGIALGGITYGILRGVKKRLDAANQPRRDALMNVLWQLDGRNGGAGQTRSDSGPSSSVTRVEP